MSLGQGRRLWGASLGIALFIGAPACAQQGDELRSYYTANGLLQRGLYELAIPEYRTFLGEHEGHEKTDTARYGLAVSLFRLNRLEEAAGELDGLIGEDRFQFAAEVLLLRGHCHLAAGEHEAAARRFERLLARYSDHASAGDAAALLSEARYRAGQHDRVDEAVEYLIERHPKHARRDRAELMSGLAGIARGDFASAARRLRGLMERSPDGRYADQASLLLGQSLHRLGDEGEAERWYRRAMSRERSGHAPEARFGLASLAYSQGRVDEARALLDQVLSSGKPAGRQVEARLLRGRVAFDRGEYDKASEHFAAVGEAKVEALYDDAAYWLAKVDLREDRPAIAAERLDELVRTSPKSQLLAEAMFDRGVALSRAGDAQGAFEAYGLFLDRFEGHALGASALRMNAGLAHELGRYDESLELCGEFLEAYPEHEAAGDVLFLAGENDYLAGRFEDALGLYERVLEDGASEGLIERATYRRGMALVRLDRFDDAVGSLERVVGEGDTPGAYLPALFAMADGLFVQGRWERSERLFVDYLGAESADSELLDDALIKVGVARMRLDDPTGAAAAFSRLLKEYPKSTHALQARFELAQADVLMGNAKVAGEGFEAVLAEGPESRFAPHALRHLGAIAMEAERYEVAAEYYARLAAIGGDDGASAMLRRGQSLLAAGKAEESLEALEAAMGAGGEGALQARAHRAIALARLERHEEAADEVAEILGGEHEGLSEDLVRSLRYERAWALRKLDRAAEANVAYRELLEVQPRDATRAYALLDLGGLEMDGGRYDEAVGPLEEALAIGEELGDELDPRIVAQSEYRLGVAQFRRGKAGEAADRLGGFASRHPESPLAASAGLIAGESLFQLGRFEQASRELDLVVREHADDPSAMNALLRLGESEAALQRWAKSERAFGEFLKRHAKSELGYQARFGLAWSRENQGQYDVAIKGYREVVATHKGPTAARAQFQIGECLFAQKKLSEAVTEFLRVDILYAVPEWTAAALYEAGRCFEAMRQGGQARVQYAEVIERFEKSDWARLSRERLDAIAETARRGG